MANDSERYAMLGFEVAAELMRRRRAGEAASAAELERTVCALIIAKPTIRFKQFIAEGGDQG